MNIAQSWIQQRLADVLTDASPPLGLRKAVVTMAPRPALVITGREALAARSPLAGVYGPPHRPSSTCGRSPVRATMAG